MSNETPLEDSGVRAPDEQKDVRVNAKKTLVDFEKKYPYEKLKNFEKDGTIDRELKRHIVTAQAVLNNLEFLNQGENFDEKKVEEAISVLDNFMKKIRDGELVKFTKEDERDKNRATKNLERYMEGKKTGLVSMLELKELRCTSLGEKDAYGFYTFWEIQRRDGIKAYLSSTGPDDLVSAYCLFQNKDKTGPFLSLLGDGGAESTADSISLFIERHASKFDHNEVRSTSDFTLTPDAQKLRSEFQSLALLLVKATENLQCKSGYDSERWEYDLQTFLAGDSTVQQQLLKQDRTVCGEFERKVDSYLRRSEIQKVLTSGQRSGYVFQTVKINGATVALNKFNRLEAQQRGIQKTLAYLEGVEAILPVKNELNKLVKATPDSVEIGKVFLEATSSPERYDVVKKTNANTYISIGFIQLQPDKSAPIKLIISNPPRTQTFEGVNALRTALDSMQ